jgi:arylsulfatase
MQQFGKNHLGDRDEHLPTNHGFDEFFGNLYHLNAEEEPENEDYPGDMVTADGKTFREIKAGNRRSRIPDR